MKIDAWAHMEPPLQKKKWGVGGGRGRVGGGQGGCDRIIEVFANIHQKKIRAGGPRGRVGGGGWGSGWM